MRTGLALALLLAALLPAAPLGAQDAVEAQGASDSRIVLYPGDLIRVQVYREQELNGEFLVDEEGRAVLPLIGEQRVAGVPIRELRTQLVEAYRQHLRNPSISITPLRRITVIGEVVRPGLLVVDPTVSLAAAIGMAGGATPDGDMRRVNIVRDGRVFRDQVGMGETLSGADIRSGDQIIVQQRSWFSRNSTFLVSALLTLASVISSIVVATQ